MRDLVHKITSEAKMLKDSSIKKKVDGVIRDNLEYVSYPKTKISLCGRFNAGKSALINAILQSNVVISRPISSTGVITRVYYSPSESYTLIKNNNGRGELESFSVEHLTDVTVKDNFNNSENVLNITRVDIGIPNVFLRGDIEIYDTPGLEDSDNRMSDVALTHLNHSDFIIFVIDAMQLKDQNALLMRYYERLGKNVIFVANKMDAIEEEDRQEIKDLSRVYFSNYFNPLTYNSDIFFVSAKVKDKNMIELSSYFRKYISTNASKIAAVSRLSILKYELQFIYEEMKGTIEESGRSNKRILIDDKKTLSSILIELTRQITNKQLS